MNVVGIEQRSCADATDLIGFFAPETQRPVILTDAFEHWPARRKWSWEFFRTACGDDMGMLRISFAKGDPKLLTKVGTFIECLDQPIDAIGGFWLDASGRPTDEPANLGSYPTWSFGWHTFNLHPELRNDISPFAKGVPNLLANFSDEMRDVLESICDIETSTIYLSRKGAIAPFHIDFFHTFGSLFQFEGRKKVLLAAPRADLDNLPDDFDPDEPGLKRYPALSGVDVYHATLEPGQCLIMPPDWWHSTKTTDHSMTLSCNFFNEFNFSDFMACFLKAALEDERAAKHVGLLDRICQAAIARNRGEPA